jgi:hypothetical protein
MNYKKKLQEKGIFSAGQFSSKTSSPVLVGIRFSNSSMVNSLDLIKKRIPIGISIEKLLPLPGVTSKVSLFHVRFQQYHLLYPGIQK